jgi:predicted DNA-binding protein
MYVADESGWTLSTAINACIESGLEEIENYLDYFAEREGQQARQRGEDAEQAALEAQAEKHTAEVQAAREKRAAERVKQLKKQGKLKS